MRIVIVGAGVAGCVMARRLSRLRWRRSDLPGAGDARRSFRGRHRAQCRAERGQGGARRSIRNSPISSRPRATSGTIGGYRSPTAPCCSICRWQDVADGPGWRIRWSELYRVLREAAGDSVLYGCEITEISRDSCRSRARHRWHGLQDGKPRRLDGIDLLIAADGRYSAVRRAISGRTRSAADRRRDLSRAGAGYVKRPDRRLRAVVQRSQPAAVVPRTTRPRLCCRHVSDSPGGADRGSVEGARRAARRLHAAQRAAERRRRAG